MANKANVDGREILGCLIFDEMAIRKMQEYDQHRDESVGFVDFGTNIFGANDEKYAKEALVFLITGVNENFKIPVAYFLIAGLKSAEKAALTREVILLTSKTGVKIVGLTFDGIASNSGMVRTLGADFKNERPFITNPHSSDKIYVYPDACHMLKLVRNCLAGKYTLFDGDNEIIEWRYIEELEKYQRVNNINLGNKIGKPHIQWMKRKMSVRIAAETLSNSTADAIEFLCNSGIKEFHGSSATIRFIRRFNNIFDIMNSKTEAAIGFKRSISPENKIEYFKYFDESIIYIQNLKLEKGRKSILKTRSKMPFFGLTIDMQNFRSFYMEHVESGILENVSTFRFSQDHLELLFGSIRQMFGCNDNPSAKQFESAWRRLLGQHQITASDHANCENNDTQYLTVLNTSSRKKSPKSNVLLSEEENDNAINNVNIQDELEDLDLILSDTVPVGDIEYHAIAFLASVLQQNIVEGRWYSPLKCDKCLLAFQEDELIDDPFVNLKTRTKKLNAPAKSTMEICMLTRTLMEKHEIKPGSFNIVLSEALQVLECKNIFSNSDFDNHSETGHKRALITMIIRMYFKKKQDYISKFKTQAAHHTYVRSYLRKYTHREGQ